jgi:phosphocarrier protein
MEVEMINGNVVIKSETGLHLRPAGDLCKLAMEFPCKIEMKLGNRTVNAKSVLGVLSACIKFGDEVEVICDGENEDEAFDKIVDALESEFVEYHEK